MLRISAAIKNRKERLKTTLSYAELHRDSLRDPFIHRECRARAGVHAPDYPDEPLSQTEALQRLV